MRRPFRNIIHDFSKFGILLLKELVQVVDWGLPRSSVVPGFGIKNILVGQQCVEDLHNTVALLIRKVNIGFHDKFFPCYWV